MQPALPVGMVLGCRAIVSRAAAVPKFPRTATDPIVVVEVLSPSTEPYDRAEKLRQYRQLPSLAHAVLISHEGKRIEVWSRGPDGFSVAVSGAGERAALPAIDCELDVDAIYRDSLAP